MAGPNGGSPEAVRAFNRARILAAVRSGRATTRNQLCDETGLSRSTVTTFVLDLLGEGVLVETAPGSGGQPGRPTRQLRPAPRTERVVAVDFGHSHCRVGIVDATGRVLAEHNATLDVDSSPDDALTHAAGAIESLLAGAERGRVVGGAVGLPAPIDVATGAVGPGNILPRWVDRRPAHELQQALGIGFAADNDANLGALAEASFGIARGVADLIYVKASTGIGAGFILGGRVHRGATGRAGEIGHVPIDPTGTVCRCGNRGCLETLASVGQVLAALQPRDTEAMTVARLVDLVDGGDAGAARVVEDAGRMIGRVLADAVNNLNPAMVVLGGELAAVGAPLSRGVRESIERYAQPGIARDMRIETSSLGSRGELIGAAALALERVEG